MSPQQFDSFNPVHFGGKLLTEEQAIRQRDAPDLATTRDLWSHTRIVAVPQGLWTNTVWRKGGFRQGVWVSSCFPVEGAVPIPNRYEDAQGRFKRRASGSRVDRRFWCPVDALRNIAPLTKLCPGCHKDSARHGGVLQPGFVIEEAADLLLHRGRRRLNRAKWLVVEVWEDRLRLLPLRGWPWYLEDPLGLVWASAPMSASRMAKARMLAAPLKEALDALSPSDRVAVLEALRPPRPLA